MNRLILIAALDEGGLIGRDGQLPWHLPEDLKRFRRLTVGHTILMGRRTYESLGRPLPERDNWVLTRDTGFSAPGCRVFHALSDALDATTADGRLMVIGGADLYRQTLPRAERLELTLVHAHLSGDTRFPDFEPGVWHEVARETHSADQRHCHAYSFVTLERR